MRQSWKQYDANAVRYYEAAQILLQKNENDYLIAPTCHALGMSIELKSKAFLLHAGCSDCELKKLGHDLLALWSHEHSLALRKAVDLVAPDFMHLIEEGPREGSAPRRETVPSEEFMRHLEFLANGYGRDSGFALRYPKSAPDYVIVPTVEFLVPVFEPAIHLRPGQTLVRAD